MIIDDYEVVFHCTMTPEQFGLTKEQADNQDMAKEYAVCACEKASAGLIVYAKQGNEWVANPWSSRFLVRELLKRLGTKI